MSNIILHISDLHVSLDEKFTGEVKNHDSYLSATEENDSSLLYIERFIDFVKRQIEGKTIYLLITGDITDWGEQTEFEYAEIYLNKIITELNISKENILLIPGDHDLNRRAIENRLAEDPNSQLESINEAKFYNFKNFYNSFLGKEFHPNSVVFENLIIDEKLQLIGINSSYKIDLKQTEGLISIEKFEEEIKPYLLNKELKSVICCHHNVVSVHENKKSGQWKIDNRTRFLNKLQELEINFIFSGNEHTSSLEKHSQSEILISDSGPISSKKNDSAFKIYDVEIADNITLKNNIYGLIKTGAFDNPYHWEQRNNTLCKQDDEIEIKTTTIPNITEEVTEILSEVNSSNDELTDVSISVPEENEKNIYENQFYTEELYKKVKDLNLFHSGHFHWSETSRAHNWIDISKLIENKENLNFLKNAIIDVLEAKIQPESIDLIIGLGYEGNILATKTAIKFNKPYTFLPYSYRHNEHHYTETELNFNNEEKKFKVVLIITDVVNDGRTIRKLIKKRQNDFFSNVDKVYVISLFYTGDSILNNNILNIDFMKTKTNYDLTTDEEVNNIEFYTVKSLKVEKCPYGKNFRNECFIYKDELNCVNLFYDEKNTFLSK
ncbi:metallophosphoesterase [Epilithonimonas zeae]|uniref:3',5'-cyclic AMP phosphodiesterase CpdA n=1 Tax=Epilithonimonas zeae TaxID=1416779 RepID=A0A1N6EVP8_9FLAO|nr:metallophosphoesterase [Epilithonimonas zeae]SIN87115.1 3',5'-cyclic AMP phosphodiesterase CpdA [Epilithonimonas zeae]